jgi:hypothetical protein
MADNFSRFLAFYAISLVAMVPSPGIGDVLLVLIGTVGWIFYGIKWCREDSP